MLLALHSKTFNGLGGASLTLLLGLLCSISIVLLCGPSTVMAQRIAVVSNSALLVSTVENATVSQYTKVAGSWIPTSIFSLSSSPLTAQNVECGAAIAAGSASAFAVSILYPDKGIVSLRWLSDGTEICRSTSVPLFGYCLSQSADGVVAACSPNERKVTILSTSCQQLASISAPAPNYERIVSVIITSTSLYVATNRTVYYYGRSAGNAFTLQGQKLAPDLHTITALSLSTLNSTTPLHVGFACTENCATLTNPSVAMGCGRAVTDGCTFRNVSAISATVTAPFAAIAATVPTTPTATTVWLIRTRTALIAQPSSPSALNLATAVSISQAHLNTLAASQLHVATRLTSIMVVAGSSLLQWGVPVVGGWTNYTSPSPCKAPEGINVTCGTGLIYQHRTCSNPYPEFQGAACNGNRFVTQACSVLPRQWIVGNFSSSCTMQSCGSGVQTRSVTCQQCPYDGSVILPDSSCTGTKPATTQSCIAYTYNWTFTESACTRTGCYTGVKTRTVTCSRCDGQAMTNVSLCNSQPAPATSVACDGEDVTKSPFTSNYSSWDLTDFECVSVKSCGETRNRTFACLDCRNNTVNTAYCTSTPPVTTQDCPCGASLYFDNLYMQSIFSSCGDRGCSGDGSSCVRRTCTFVTCSIPSCRKPSGGGGCFSGNNWATLCNGTKIRIRDLKAKVHSVLTRYGCEPVLDWFDHSPSATVPFYRICAGPNSASAPTGALPSDSPCVELTRNHIMYLDRPGEKPLPVLAGDVKVGDSLSSHLGKSLNVTSVSPAHSLGYFVPVTPSSTILIGGIHCDVLPFSTKFRPLHFLFDNWPRQVTRFQHVMMYPAILAATYLPTVHENEVHWYPVMIKYVVLGTVAASFAWILSSLASRAGVKAGRWGRLHRPMGVVIGLIAIFVLLASQPVAALSLLEDSQSRDMYSRLATADLRRA